MSEREELEALRRMAELEAKAGGSSLPKSSSKSQADLYAGRDVGQMGSVMRGLGGAKTAFDRAAMGLKGLVTDLTPEDRALLAGGKAFQDEGGMAATVGSIGADVGMSLAPGALVTKATAAAPVLTRTLSQLGLGAGYGALTSPEDRTAGAVGGAVGTAAGMGINRLAGGVIRPLVSKDAQALMARGIQPTPGQAIGGAVNTAEQKLKSLPLIGDVIRSGRERAVNEFNEKAIQTAVPGATGFGDEALIAARQTLGTQYEDVLGRLPNITMDKGAIVTAATEAAGDAALGLNNASKKYIQDYVGKNLIGRSQNISGETAKRVESDLLKLISNKRSSSDSEQRAVGEALSKVHDAWRTSLAQTAEAVQPGAGKALSDANASWRAFSALDRAGGYRGSQNAATNEVTGRFTPNSLRRSIEASDVSQNNNVTRALRGGDAPFQRLNTLTRQGERVLGDSVPDSGTATRLMYGAGALGAGAATGADLGTSAALGALSVPMYSRMGSQFLMKGATPAYESAVKALTLRGVPTQAIDEALRKYGPEGVISLARSAGVNSQQ
jgi:hypothetical protein